MHKWQNLLTYEHVLRCSLESPLYKRLAELLCCTLSEVCRIHCTRAGLTANPPRADDRPRQILGPGQSAPLSQSNLEPKPSCWSKLKEADVPSICKLTVWQRLWFWWNIFISTTTLYHKDLLSKYNAPELQNSQSWKGPIRIIESNSGRNLLLIQISSL